MTTSTNIFNNIAMITTKALDSVKNNTVVASRVARRWDGDFAGSGRIGDTLNIRIPGFMNYRSGAVAQPTGYNDTYVPLTLSQGGVDIVLTEKEMTLNVDDFNHNVVEPMATALWQKFDTSIINAYLPSATSAGVNQFAGSVGTAITNLQPFNEAYAVMKAQSATPVDGKVSGLLNVHSQASMFGGLSQIFNPSAEISDIYRNGTIAKAYGIDYFDTANAPAFTLGTWSGTQTVTTSLPTDGGNTLNIAGQTGSFAVGECFTIAGVYAVNPQGKGLQAELKMFTVLTSSNGQVTVSPSFNLTGPNQNINALPTSGAAIYPWGTSSANALAAGTGQILKTSLVFHEDAFAFGMSDITDAGKAGGVISKRYVDDKTGLRCRGLFWYNGYTSQMIFRLDALWGTNMLRQGFAARVIQ